MRKAPIRNRIGVMIIVMAGLIGCDSRPAPQADDSDTKTADSSKGPTTRELLVGPRNPLSLGYIPFKVNVPPGWEIEATSNGAMAFLKGPTPSGGEVQIQLSLRPTQNSTQLEFLLSGAKKDAEKHADSVRKFNIRQQGEMTVLERQTIGQPITLPGGDEKALIDSSPEYRWTIHFFVPRGKDYAQYEMNFLGLTSNRFNADKVFLESILKTVEVDTPQPAKGL